MHEFGLCESILDAVERRAAGRSVTRVSIRCGVFNRVDGPSMRQAFALVADGSVAADAALDLTVVSRPAGVCRMRAGQRGRRDRRPVPGLPRAGRRPERRRRADPGLLGPGRNGAGLMCLGIPARVTAPAEVSHPAEAPYPAGSDLVQVEMAGVTRLINAGLLDVRPRPGDWVLVHMGFALSTMSQAEADEALAAFTQMSAERTGMVQEGTRW